MTPIIIPSTYNYIAIFLTFACNLKCSYCINAHSKIDRKRRLLSGQEWVEALGRIVTRSDLPITFGGGEPTLHPDFYYIVKELHRKNVPMDLLTNCQFEVDEFMENVSSSIFKRPAPYASIRVSYHSKTMDLFSLLKKVCVLRDDGYSIGIWSVNHPLYESNIELCQYLCHKLDIDFRLKEFLGIHNGKSYGTYKYPNACNSDIRKEVMCKTSELIVGPDGNVYRCHADLYEQRWHIGNIMDDNFDIKDEYLPCDKFGSCNPCDQKLKYNRFQEKGHCSVSIKEVE